MEVTPLLLRILLLVSKVFAFNVDVRTATVQSSPAGGGREDYFGYSVAFTQDKKLLVGAPRSNSSTLTAQEPGALYSCAPQAAGSACVRLVVDGSDTGTYTESIQNRRDFAWLGGSIVSGSDGVLVCSPRWAQTLPDEWFLNGACYWATQATREWQKLLPLSELSKQRIVPPGAANPIFYYQYGQAGLSAAILPDSGDVVIGAPGVANWAGTLIRGQQRPLVGGSVMVTSVVDPPAPLYGYLGYSVTAGRYHGNEELVVAAAPRAGDSGKLYILRLHGTTASAAVVAELDGRAAYGGYGHSLATGDYDGDGHDELVVGAPLVSNDGFTEDGMVLVYGSGPQGLPLVERRTLQPIRSGGRFGSALATVGDLDNDGYVDLAVGAPLEDGGQGAVYIYSGGPAGVGPSAAQRIAASAVHRAIRGFGGSLAGGVDLDGNGYDDFAVGAAGSTAVLTSRAVVTVTTAVELDPATLSADEQQFRVAVCVLCSGHGLPAYIDVTVAVGLDAHLPPPTARAHFTPSALPTAAVGLRVPAQQRACAHLTAQLNPTISDISLPMTVAASVTSEGYVTSEDLEASPCTTCPVLHPHSIPTASTEGVIAPGCGGDHSCTPVLTVKAFFPSGGELVVGSRGPVELVVEVAVAEESAYKTTVTVQLPVGVTVLSLPVECTVPNRWGSVRLSQSQLVSCSLQSPIRAGETVSTRLLTTVRTTVSTAFSPIDSTAVSTAVTPQLEYVVDVTALNAAVTATAVLHLVTDVRLSVWGRAEPERVVYGVEGMSALRPLDFRIQVQNIGVTTAAALQLQLLLPAAAGPRRLLQDIQVKSSSGRDCVVGQQRKRDIQNGGAAQNGGAKQDGGSEQDGVSEQNGGARQDGGSVQDGGSGENGGGAQTGGQDGGSEQDGGVSKVISCSGDDDESCVMVTCSLGSPSSAFITLTAAVDSSALEELYGAGAVVTLQLSASALDTNDISTRVSQSVEATVAPVGWSPSAPTSAPWWVLALAAGGGVLLLGGITYLLYRCGFFKRKRPPVSQDAASHDGDAAGEEFEDLTEGVPLEDAPGDLEGLPGGGQGASQELL